MFVRQCCWWSKSDTKWKQLASLTSDYPELSRPSQCWLCPCTEHVAHITYKSTKQKENIDHCSAMKLKNEPKFWKPGDCVIIDTVLGKPMNTEGFSILPWDILLLWYETDNCCGCHQNSRPEGCWSWHGDQVYLDSSGG